VVDSPRHWLAALTAAAIMVVTGIAPGQAARVSQAHEASYAHHQVVPEGHRPVGTFELTHFMPDTQPSVELVLLIRTEDRSAAAGLTSD
jgi:hypothetical protein